MTLKEVIEYWDRFNAKIDDLLLLYCSGGDYRKTLEEQREVAKFTIAALRQREEFMPPCYKPDSGDGECAYQIYGSDDDEPIERCKACPLCYSDKMRHHKPKTPCDLCPYNPPSGRARELIAAAPATDVAPVVYGKWIHSEIEDDDWGGTFHEWTCSVCGYSVGYNPTGENYCSNCGARMGQITHWVPLPESSKEKK